MNNVILTLEEILVVLIVVSGTLLSVWVWRSDKESRLNQLFSVMTISAIFWTVFSFLGFLSDTPWNSIIFYKINAASVIIFLISSFYFYVIHFLEYKNFKKYKIIGRLIFSFGLLLILLSLFTNTIIKDVTIKSSGAEIVFGEANIFFNLYAFFVAILVVSLLIKRYIHLDRREKLKVQYFLLGTILFTLFNIIFNIFSPIFTGTVAYQHLGDYSAIFLIGFTAYAIVKKNLFGIKVVLTEVLVSIIVIILFVNIFISKGVFEYMWKGSLFLIFIYFGKIMIRSVRKEIEAEKQLEKYSRELKKTNEHLEELDKQKTEFMSFAAHQLRAPLTSVKGFASMITERGLGRVPKKVKGAAEKIYEASEAMSDSVDDYLNISRIEQGRMEYEMEELDLHELAQEVKEELEPTAHKKKLKLSLSSDKYKTYPVQADHSKLRQIIYNFTENAIKYTPKGKVVLRVSRQKGYVTLAIKDSGIGMSQATIKKLFRRYSRAQNTQGISGTGLGLYVARKMIEAQKGKVWAESAGEGQGSTFYIKLPLLKKTKKKK